MTARPAVPCLVPRYARGALAVLSLTFAFAIWAAPSALAALTHEYLSEITEVPASSGAPVPGPISDPESMTVASSDLWIAEDISGTSRVDEFEASTGAFVQQFPQQSSLQEQRSGIAIDEHGGETSVYVGAANESSQTVIAVYSESGSLRATWSGAQTPAAEFGQVSSVAVDGSAAVGDWASDDVYVADPSYKAIDVFEPQPDGSEKYVTQLTGMPGGEEFSEPTYVAVDDANGDLLVADHTGERWVVDVIAPVPGLEGQYEEKGQISGPPPTGDFGPEVIALAVDGSASPGGDVYVAENRSAFESESGVESETAVYEFALNGQYLGQITGEGAPSGSFAEAGDRLSSVAVDPGNHHVFVGAHAESNGVVEQFGANLTVPTVETGAARSLTPVGATLTGSVNPEGAGEATCRFAWGTAPALDKSVPCSSPVAEGASPAPVEAKLEGLTPDTTYYYLLEAADASGVNHGERWQERSFTTPGPGLGGTWATEVAATTARLNAEINPHGTQSYYYFEYGPAGGGVAKLPASPVPIGAGEAPVEVTEGLRGLQPGTAYDYRIVVVSEIEGHPQSFTGEELSFTTQDAGITTGLLDDRAWEIVSPTDRPSTLVQLSSESLLEAAADGEAVAYETLAPVGRSPESNPGETELLSRRAHDGGWTTSDIAAPSAGAIGVGTAAGGQYRFFSTDLATAIVEPLGALLLGDATEQTVYLRATGCQEATSCYEPLLDDANVAAGVEFGRQAKFVDANAQATAVILSSEEQLTETPAPAGGLYEWAGGRLVLISALPSGEAASSPQLGLHGTVDSGNTRDAISAAGTRVWWSSEGHLYLRDTTSESTIEIDEPEAGVNAEGTAKAEFQLASASGSDVTFTDTQRLTANATAAPTEPDLYECSIAVAEGKPRCELADLTVAASNREHADVQGLVLGAGGEGEGESDSYVYFVARGALPSAANAGGETPSPGGENLYRLRRSGETWETSFVAGLSTEDAPDWGGAEALASEDALTGLSARVSPNGQWLAFMSDRDITGYDSHDAANGEATEEVYLYHASPEGPGSLICGSCEPSGARPEGVRPVFGQETLTEGHINWSAQSVAGLIPGWTPMDGGAARFQSRYLSNVGRLFFDSPDALVPQDANGTWDVYEFEPVGVGSCTSASESYDRTSGGCVALISSGTSSDESAFVDASENGDDVFFLTSSQLVKADTSDDYQLYDAHVCSEAAPCASATVAQGPCASSEACRGSNATNLGLPGAPASESFAGAGQVGAPSTTGRAGIHKKLERALRLCKRLRKHKARRRCEAKARRKYGSKSPKKKKRRREATMHRSVAGR